MSSDGEFDMNALGGMMGGGGLGCMDPDFDRKFLATLPQQVRDRVTVLQVMDKEVEKINRKHEEDIMILKRKFAKLAEPFFAKRAAIVKGEEEPKESDITKGFPEEHKGEVSLTEGSAEGAKEKGIPNFWYEVLTHHVIIAQMITERDAEALQNLVDITYQYLDEPEMGFTINFHFDPTKKEFFEEEVLSKSFFLKEVNEELALEKTVGTSITYLEGKALNVNTVSKKQKNKKGQVRYKTEEQPCETFFDFFSTKCEEEDDEQFHAMAETIKDKMIPYAVEYYTGEADNGEDDMEGDQDEMDEEDEDEEEEEEPMPVSRGRGRGAGGAAGGRGRGGAGGQQECPQQ